MEIRVFRKTDAKDMVKLHDESSGSFEEVCVTEDFLRSIAERSDFRFLVASENNRVVGFVGFLYHTNVKRAELGPICVASEHRRKGLGSRLLDCALAELRAEGIKRTTVKVKAENRDALSFFGKRGFSEEGFFEGYTASGEDVVQLRRFM